MDKSAAAYEIYRRGGRLRDAIEGLLLAAEGVGWIAKFTALPWTVVQRYADLWYDQGYAHPLSRGHGLPRIGLSIVPETYDGDFHPDNVEAYWKSISPTDDMDEILGEIDRAGRIGQEPNLDTVSRRVMRLAARRAASGRCDLKALSRALTGLQELRENFDAGQTELTMLKKAIVETLVEDAPWRLATEEDFADELSQDDLKRSARLREQAEKGRQAEGGAQTAGTPDPPPSPTEPDPAGES